MVVCSNFLTLMDNLKNQIVEQLSSQVTDIIFNREAGWSSKLEEAITSALTRLEAATEARIVGEIRRGVERLIELGKYDIPLPMTEDSILNTYDNGWKTCIEYVLSLLPPQEEKHSYVEDFTDKQ